MTTLRGVADTKPLQVNLHSGEVYDRIELLAQDERRNVAAIRILAAGLPTMPSTTLAEMKPGDEVHLVCNSPSAGWISSKGTFDCSRMADTVPGAGSGFRLVSYFAPVPPESRGGVLLDRRGGVLSLILNGKNGWDAILGIPFESVAGLANVAGGLASQSATVAPSPAPVPAPSPLPDQPPSQVATTTAKPKIPVQPSDLSPILRNFHSYYLNIETIFLERPVLQEAIDQRPEFKAWNLVRTENPASADVIITFTLPALSWEWNYAIAYRATGQSLGTGSVRALEEYQASALLASRIVNTIQTVRGAPDMRLSSSLAAPGAHPGLKTWSVKGVGGVLDGRDLTLSITRESILVSGLHVASFRIPTHDILYVYHLEIEDLQSLRDLMNWEKGWDEACMLTQGNDSRLAAYAFPLYLAGEFLLLGNVGVPTHSIVLRVLGRQSVNEMTFFVASAEWLPLLADLQSVIPGGQKGSPTEANDLRKGFDAAKENAVQILLQSPVDVGRWPTLEPGDYRLVINEHDAGRADVFFYKLPTVDFSRPRAVAAAHLERISLRVSESKVTFLEKGGLRLLDEIRAGGLLLRFD